MMINKRLISTIPDSKKHILKKIFFQWISLISNITIIYLIGDFLQSLYYNTASLKSAGIIFIHVILFILIRYRFDNLASNESFLASKNVKLTLREMIYSKLLVLGKKDNYKNSTSEIVQVSIEGTEQLETYFGLYLPQFFYSILAPITLFLFISTISFKTALILLLCVPFIPLSIILVQKLSKKLLGKYWGQYTKLGDSFLENLHGLTTLKIYQSDQFKHDQMNKEAENFRKITMKVLTMQLNSITIMDLIAYGGASIGIIVAILEFSNGSINLFGCFMIIMLSADFFLPLRLLGSYFHIAMNGMSASDKIFDFLDTPTNTNKVEEITDDFNIEIKNLSYSYNKNILLLSNISMSFPENSFTSIVGESGSGKSTIATIITGLNNSYSGSATISGCEINTIKNTSLMKNITLVNTNSYIFKGSLRSNLLLANPAATDQELFDVLNKVDLFDFAKSNSGLDMPIFEKGSNLSGGQKQRLALARGILHDSKVYIFDESTSSIDSESENKIISVLHDLSKTKTIILISHRLLNVVLSDNIYVLKSGELSESGTHKSLLENNNTYANLWNSQLNIENHTGKVVY